MGLRVDVNVVGLYSRHLSALLGLVRADAEATRVISSSWNLEVRTGTTRASRDSCLELRACLELELEG